MLESIKELVEIEYIKSLTPEEINKIMNDFNENIRKLEEQLKGFKSQYNKSEKIIKILTQDLRHALDTLISVYEETGNVNIKNDIETITGKSIKKVLEDE